MIVLGGLKYGLGIIFVCYYLFKYDWIFIILLESLLFLVVLLVGSIGCFCGGF